MPKPLAALRAALRRLVCARSQRERELEAELRKFSRAVEQSPSTVMITDLAGNIEYVNPKFTELTGYTLDEVRGRNPRFLKSGHTPDEEYARMWRTISSGGEWRGVLHNVKKNGERYWESALMAPIKNADGQITHYIALKEDITARKAAEDALRAHAEEMERRVAERTADLEHERALLRAILDAMTEGVLYVEGRTITYSNRALGQMLGLPPDSLLGRDLPALYGRVVRSGPTYEHLRTVIDSVLDRDPLWSGELSLERPDGTRVDVAVITAQVSGPTGERLGRVSVLRDISHEKDLNEQRERFLRHAAHELRTPLSNFKTRLYLLRRQPERLFSHLAVMERVSDEMNELVEDLLDVFRLQRDTNELGREDVELCVLLDDVVAACQAAAEHQKAGLRLSMAGGPVFVWADPERLRQALVRLVASALDATDEGGVVEVSLAVEPGEAGNWAVISVSDNGPGLPPDQLPHVFDPFYRVAQGAHSAGVGLGLTLARQIVELHQGTLTARNAAGRGTVFEVRLLECASCYDSAAEELSSER
ncbi:MAG: PAS domain S-box protein [Chloroflexota bacterium]|jgi:PAS domain S-box-containing protein|nr:PAS domain S-box protein [Anaerolineae bacterium]HMM28563.1 PAS domain S-box protein [Aggregatilineaceae bacterium]